MRCAHPGWETVGHRHCFRRFSLGLTLDLDALLALLVEAEKTANAADGRWEQSAACYSPIGTPTLRHLDHETAAAVDARSARDGISIPEQLEQSPAQPASPIEGSAGRRA